MPQVALGTVPSRADTDSASRPHHPRILLEGSRHHGSMSERTAKGVCAARDGRTSTHVGWKVTRWHGPNGAVVDERLTLGPPMSGATRWRAEPGGLVARVSPRLPGWNGPWASTRSLAPSDRTLMPCPDSSQPAVDGDRPGYIGGGRQPEPARHGSRPLRRTSDRRLTDCGADRRVLRVHHSEEESRRLLLGSSSTRAMHPRCW